MDLRSILGSLQLPVATVGTLLVVVAVGSVATMPSPPPESEGVVAGLAVLFMYVLAWVGFLVTSLGLAIPPGDGYGVTFTRYQRGLFVLAAVAGLLSAVGPFVAFGLVYSNPSLMTTAWLALASVAVLSLAAGLVWRGVQAVRAWRFGAGPSVSD
ncbi:hypothetical protein BRC92_10060 [Halobacteriales archaeon QS_4_69_31]|nr:MAG: hypothetical protein BRC92_10060 [Halobacteriales archaeon QS_4_69_31]